MTIPTNPPTVSNSWMPDTQPQKPIPMTITTMPHAAKRSYAQAITIRLPIIIAAHDAAHANAQLTQYLADLRTAFPTADIAEATAFEDSFPNIKP